MKKLEIRVFGYLILYILSTPVVAQYIEAGSETLVLTSESFKIKRSDLDKLPKRMPMGGIQAELAPSGLVTMKLFYKMNDNMNEKELYPNVYSIYLNQNFESDDEFTYREFASQNLDNLTLPPLNSQLYDEPIRGNAMKKALNYLDAGQYWWGNNSNYEVFVELTIQNAKVTGLNIPGWNFEYEGSQMLANAFAQYYSNWDNHWWELFEDHVHFDSPHNMYFPLIESGESSLYISNATGFIGIGIDESKGALPYEVVVNGSITSGEMIIKEIVPADYVFEPDYPLSEIEELASYIDEHRHLPGVPSEKEAIEQGVGFGALEMKLLEKVEELTLYTIEQQKSIEMLKSKIHAIKNN